MKHLKEVKNPFNVYPFSKDENLVDDIDCDFEIEKSFEHATKYFILEGDSKIVEMQSGRKRKVKMSIIDLYTKDGKEYGYTNEYKYTNWTECDEKSRDIDFVYPKYTIACINFKFYTIEHTMYLGDLNGVHEFNKKLNNQGIKSSVFDMTREREQIPEIIDKPFLPMIYSCCTRDIISRSPKIIFDFDYIKFTNEKDNFLKSLDDDNLIRQTTSLFKNTIKSICRYYDITEKALKNDSFCKFTALNRLIEKRAKLGYSNIKYYDTNMIV